MLIGLGLLVVAVVIAVFVWNFRRHAAAREAASAARMKAFLEEARAKAGRSAADTPAAAPASAPAAITPQPQTSAFTARTQLLSPDHSLLYRLLKSGLPDHDIFARVSLAA